MRSQPATTLLTSQLKHTNRGGEWAQNKAKISQAGAVIFAFNTLTHKS
jgi:hypothetical protein